jgi:hypothetical protein
MTKMLVVLSAMTPIIISLLTCVGYAVEDNPFDAEVLEVRPRVFLRNAPFEGLTIEKLRNNVQVHEFVGVQEAWGARPMGRALLWMLDGEQEDLEAAIEGLRRMDASGGTWSDRGLALLRLATLFDWLYEELDEPDRREIIQKIERAADAAALHVREGQAPFFYSRTPSALAGLCVAGLALHGESEKAEYYLATFREFGVDEYFKAYEWVDGAATGATYTMYYTYTALPSICAAWWSATDRNPTDWIKAEQGDWLNDMVRFYLWYMRPGFAFTDINDQFRGDWQSHDQFCQGLDIAAYLTRDGYGRAWSQRWYGRFGRALYHPEYAHNFMFRDPDLTSVPLVDLPRAALFGRDSCGYGFFRSYWPEDKQPDDAVHVFFRCGDPMNVHGGVSAGEFQIFKYAPLASRGGRYSSYDSPPDQYHRNCVSTNVVLFTDPSVPEDRGDQLSRRGLKSDHATWEDWMRIRERNQLDVAHILDWQVDSNEARCRADLTKTNLESKCRKWIREFVWLNNKHLIVLDIIETAKPEIRRQWQLHLPDRPEFGERLFDVTNRLPEQSWYDPSIQLKNRTGRLYCQTILPREYLTILHSDGEAEAFDQSGVSLEAVESNPYHLDFSGHVVQIEPTNIDTETVFLHVLTAVDAEESETPKVTYRAIDPGLIELNVDGSITTLRTLESLN